MNDPHVEALVYVVKHSPVFDYEKAQPYERELPEFHIRIDEWSQATVEPKHHFATADEARAVVEPSLRAWELDAALKHDNPDVLRFVYLAPKIIDRNPTPGVVVAHVQPLSLTLSLGKVVPRLGLKEYPASPTGLTVRPGSEVEAMFDKWGRYKAGQAELADTANFCLTALEGRDKEKDKRKKAAAKFQISKKRVLDPLGQLAERGRKYKGYGQPYTDAERAWLEEALKKIILRAAEVAHDPHATRPLIPMADLPHL